MKAKQKEYEAIQESIRDLEFINDHDYLDTEGDIPLTSLKHYNKTRWASSKVVMDSVYKNMKITNEMVRKYGRSELVISYIVTYLGHFHDISIEMEGDKYPTASLVWPNVLRMLKFSPEYNFSFVYHSVFQIALNGYSCVF